MGKHIAKKKSITLSNKTTTHSPSKWAQFSPGFLMRIIIPLLIGLLAFYLYRLFLANNNNSVAKWSDKNNNNFNYGNIPSIPAGKEIFERIINTNGTSIPFKFTWQAQTNNTDPGLVLEKEKIINRTQDILSELSAQDNLSCRQLKDLLWLSEFSIIISDEYRNNIADYDPDSAELTLNKDEFMRLTKDSAAQVILHEVVGHVKMFTLNKHLGRPLYAGIYDNPNEQEQLITSIHKYLARIADFQNPEQARKVFNENRELIMKYKPAYTRTLISKTSFENAKIAEAIAKHGKFEYISSAEINLKSKIIHLPITRYIEEYSVDNNNNYNLYGYSVSDTNNINSIITAFFHDRINIWEQQANHNDEELSFRLHEAVARIDQDPYKSILAPEFCGYIKGFYEKYGVNIENLQSVFSSENLVESDSNTLALTM